MTISGRDLLVLPFVLTRVPLYFLDRQVIRRLPVESGPRTTLDSALGAVDVWAGRFLDDDGICHLGRARQAAAQPQQRALVPRTYTTVTLRMPRQVAEKRYARTRRP